jgi:methylthioribose-1-phosphate isomerase
MNDVLDFVSVRLDDENDELIILDQSKLPNDLIYHRYKTKEEIFKAITGLEVRGAPAIGIAAAYGIYLSIKHLESKIMMIFSTSLSRTRTTWHHPVRQPSICFGR